MTPLACLCLAFVIQPGPSFGGSVGSFGSTFMLAGATNGDAVFISSFEPMTVGNWTLEFTTAPHYANIALPGCGRWLYRDVVVIDCGSTP
jgi:hypothetical protein